MRAYIRIDPELGDRKAHYPDGALAAFVLTLCFAESQPRRGYFKPAVLKALLERRARWIDYMLDHGDLERRQSLFYVVGWDEWQEGDWKVHERVARIRSRRESVTVDVTATVTPAVTVDRLAVGGRRLAVGASNSGGGRQPEVKNLTEYRLSRQGAQVNGLHGVGEILGGLRMQPAPREATQ